MKTFFRKSADITLVFFTSILLTMACTLIPPDSKDTPPAGPDEPEIPDAASNGLVLVSKYSADSVFIGFACNMDPVSIENISNFKLIFDPDKTAEEKSISAVLVIDNKSIILTISETLSVGEYEMITENLLNDDGEAIAGDSSSMRFYTVPTLDCVADINFITNNKGVLNLENQAVTLPADPNWISFYAVIVNEGDSPDLLMDARNVLAAGLLDGNGMLASSFINKNLIYYYIFDQSVVPWGISYAPSCDYAQFPSGASYDIYIRGEYDIDGNSETSDDRYYTLGDKNTFTVEWFDDCDAFISRWDTEEDTITLPLTETGIYNFTVEWGDGTSSQVTSYDDADKTHVYENDGKYFLIITGTIEGFSFRTGSHFDISEIYKWGPLKLGNDGGYFYGCHSLRIPARDVLDCSGTTNMSNFFKNCRNLSSVANINDWDVSNVTDMSSMFENAFLFNEDIGDWEVGNVTDMSSMFELNDVSWIMKSEGRSWNFNRDIAEWDTGNVLDMSHMFSGNIDFDQDIGEWDVSSVTNMTAMFAGTMAFDQDISGWDVSSVTSMSYMFSKVPPPEPDPSGTGTVMLGSSPLDFEYSFNQDIGGWGDKVANVTDMSCMFLYADEFDQDISRWNVSGVTNMFGMFAYTGSFNQDIGGWGENVANVRNMAHMFYYARSFNGDISAWNVSGVTNMSNMFSATGMFNQDISKWDVSGVTDMSGMFNGAAMFNQDIGRDPLTGTGWDVSGVTDMSAMFMYSIFNMDIGGWDVSGVTDMTWMFGRNDAFNQYIGDWDVSSVTSMMCMFNFCASFDQALSGWKDKLVSLESTDYMFTGTESFDQDISEWDVSHVTSMNGMFYKARSFDQDLDPWDVSASVGMENMFFESNMSKIPDWYIF